MNIINLAYDSTNYYLVQSNCGWVMIDTGWAGTFKELLGLLKRQDVNPQDIRHLIITHFHPDHAGLVQNIKDCGAQLVLHSNQEAFVTTLKQYFKPQLSM